MPLGRKVFTVAAPIDRVWELVSDMRQVGACVPGCEDVEVIDQDRSRWIVRAELGPFSRRLRMEATTVERQAPCRGAFVARGKDLETRGEIDLRAISETETEVTYTVRAQALGFGRGVVDNAIGLVIQDQANQFAANVIAALSTQDTRRAT